MKCPHCKLGTLGKVLETRPQDGVILRRRYCGACGGRAVTREDLFPDGVISHKWRKPGGAPKPIKGQGEALAGVWK